MNRIKLVFIHLFAVCVLLEKYTVLSSCDGIDYVQCCPDAENDQQLKCYIRSSAVDAVKLGHLLTSTTQEQRCNTLLIHVLSEMFIELQLKLSENIVELKIDGKHSMIFLNPIIPNTEVNELHLSHLTWDTRGQGLSSIFPNLEYLVVRNENHIETLDSNLLSDLNSLYSLSWVDSPLMSISEGSFKYLSSLTELDLSNNNISYLSEELIEDLPSLKVLTVDNIHCNCDQKWLADDNDKLQIHGTCMGSATRVNSWKSYSGCYQSSNKGDMIIDLIIYFNVGFAIVACCLIATVLAFGIALGVTCSICFVNQKELKKLRMMQSSMINEDEVYKYYHSERGSVTQNKGVIVDETGSVTFQDSSTLKRENKS